MSSSSLFVRLMPGLFVVLWATGFIGAKLGLPYAESQTFLALRFALVTLLVVPLAFVMKAQWPRDPRQVAHAAVVGVVVHSLYLGAVFASIEQGLPAGLSALIVCLQPILTATVVGPLLGETVRPRQVLGLVLGLLGVVMVLSGRMDLAVGAALFEGFGIPAVLLSVLALLAITFGVVYQKRFCTDLDLWAGAAIQYTAATFASGVVALAFEDNHVTWSGEFLFALGWLVLVLSIGAVSLLMLLIRLGEAGRTASLFYLVPPVTGTIAWILFDETLGPVALAGMLVAALGVALVVVRPRRG
ncbi:DMT family transporter [Fodinicurvata sediminis]|uniref:DMT family transporter n=1 Tax=Fodinicurvata sediminis TaxID=1121832 RepID=UPI0003B703B6|nr:DMT family transporter [Fodinicurvata sediminis]